MSGFGAYAEIKMIEFVAAPATGATVLLPHAARPPASASHGGVIATGGIRRDATRSLAALHLLKAGDDEGTLALRRDVFGLALVALTANTSSSLRQGCNLVIDSDKPREFHKVYRDGRREPATISHPEAIEFASAAAETFGKGDSCTVAFDQQKATADVKNKD